MTNAAIYNKAWRDRHPARSRQSNKEWTERHPGWWAIRRRQLRLEVLALYGGKCACCGESDARVLTFVHVNGGGGEERRLPGTKSSGFLYALKREHREDIQILCANCHQAKTYYGGCAHGQA